MSIETRTVQFTVDPALRAYLAWLDAERLTFSVAGFDLFIAGYRARVAEEDVDRPADRQQPDDAAPRGGE